MKEMRGMCARRAPRNNTFLALGFFTIVSLLLIAAIWAPSREGLGDIIFRLSRIISRLDPRFELTDEESIPPAPGNASKSQFTQVPAVANTSRNHQFIPGVDWQGDGVELVCDEKYMAGRHGYPFFDTGFVANVGCPSEQPLHLVITILFVLEEEFSGKVNEERLRTVLSGVKEYDSSMQILVGIPRVTEKMRELVKSTGIGSLFEYGEKSPGEAWNMLVSHTSTPFVLLARDITHFHPTHTRIRRQVRVLSGAVTVSGGATRNEEGLWSMGCLQSQIRGYTLRFTRGYKISARDCMLCDHLEGPFVTRTSVLLTHPFSKVIPKAASTPSLLKAVTFADWFLRLKQAGFLTLGCPDVMYYVIGGTEAAEGPKNFHAAWLWLATQWELTSIIHPPFPNPLEENIPQRLNFSCKEVGLSCKVKQYAKKGHIAPPCCADQVVSAIDAFDHFTSSHGTGYELEAGSALGAVKINGFIPWDIDGDVTFESKDYFMFVNDKSWFKKHGMALNDFEEPVPMHKDSPKKSPKTKGYFRLDTPDIYLEMWGYHMLSINANATPEASSEPTGPQEGVFWTTLPSANMLPTRIYLRTVGNPNGVWARVIANPGLFARNRYGARFLRHAQSWTNLKFSDSWQSYTKAAGGWWEGTPCSRTYHHACLVHYPTDGNLDFYDDGHV
ncbi:hypothetical protein J437_LFUL004320 [Ladona fulva]|uniref:LicD/FKTN/FKRP nucleotidyltransferase domain-containing protein n=1 Tax=Ladona fulva TaxID=123851 RepID=A0A8K0K6L7_LADFU|nr:hypothetical protein J437_LFUL004320 [Ladona fulva]